MRIHYDWLNLIPLRTEQLHYSFDSKTIMTSRLFNRYGFYDLVRQTPTHPNYAIKYTISGDRLIPRKADLAGLTPQQRMEKVFGGRIRGDERQSSSRLTRSEPMRIAGIEVPAKPPEPDNCCMSGCINCVWELYRDDINIWNKKRKEAAHKLNSQDSDYVWPANFHPPLKDLLDKHIPSHLHAEKRQMEETPHDDTSETWSNVPVAIRVFAEAEKKIKARQKSKANDAASKLTKESASA